MCRTLTPNPSPVGEGRRRPSAFGLKSRSLTLGLSRAWLEHVSVRRPWRRRGLAAALILSACVGLRERGIAEAALGVDSANLTGALGPVREPGVRRGPAGDLVSAGAPGLGSVDGDGRAAAVATSGEQAALAHDEVEPGALPADRRRRPVPREDPDVVLEAGEPRERGRPSARPSRPGSRPGPSRRRRACRR